MPSAGGTGFFTEEGAQSCCGRVPVGRECAHEIDQALQVLIAVKDELTLPRGEVPQGTVEGDSTVFGESLQEAPSNSGVFFSRKGKQPAIGEGGGRITEEEFNRSVSALEQAHSELRPVPFLSLLTDNALAEVMSHEY